MNIIFPFPSITILFSSSRENYKKENKRFHEQKDKTEILWLY